MIDFAGFVEKNLEAREGVGQQRSFGAKILGGQAGQGHRTFAAGPEADLALGTVLEQDLAIRRLETRFEGGLAAALALEGGQGKLNVLTRSQRVGGEVAAGAEIVSCPRTTDDHSVGALAFRVGDLEFRKEIVIALIFDAEGLIPAKLPAQFPLPIFERQVLGLVQAR